MLRLILARIRRDPRGSKTIRENRNLYAKKLEARYSENPARIGHESLGIHPCLVRHVWQVSTRLSVT